VSTLQYSLQVLRSAYRAACDASNEIIASIGDPDALMQRPTKAPIA